MEKKIEMSEAAREMKRQYKRKWYANGGREKQREYDRRYWERLAEKHAADAEQADPEPAPVTVTT